MNRSLCDTKTLCRNHRDSVNSSEKVGVQKLSEMQRKRTVFERASLDACWSEACDSSDPSVLSVPAARVRAQHPKTVSSIHITETQGKRDEILMHFI